MIKYLLIILCFFSTFFVFSQETDSISTSNITEIDTVQLEDEIDEDVPFALVENVPTYPGCKGNEDALRKCLQRSIQKHIMIKYNTGLAGELGLAPGKKVVIIVFSINKEGIITNVKASGPHERLEAEGIRVVNLLPQMTPGKQQGRSVNVNYTIPITLLIE